MNDCDIVFAISPNSASSERVFALLKNLFGDDAMSALADYVQAGLMLNYNKRRVQRVVYVACWGLDTDRL